MSPQNSTLGLMGGDFKSTFNRAGQRSGIYRPEDNAYIRNYVNRIDNFFYTGNSFTYTGTSSPSTLSSIFIRPNNTQLFSCSGFDTDGQRTVSNDSSAIFSNTFTKAGQISTLSSTTKKPTAWQTGGSSGTVWYPEPLGLSFSPDGTQLILCGNLVEIPFASTPIDRGPIIYQYTLSTPWDITTIDGSSTWSYGGTNYGAVTINPTFYSNPPSKIYYFETPPANITPTSSLKVQDIFVHPDGLVFYYIRNNILYQGSISSAWDIGVNGANLNTNIASLTIDPNLVSSATFIGSFSGFTFNTTGTKLYVTSRLYGGTILQYNLNTAWDITTASFETFLYVGQFKSESQGTGKRAIMLDDGETMIHSTVNGTTSILYEYKLLPY